MAEKVYIHGLAEDFPNGINAPRLADEIAASAIVTVLDRIDIDPNGDDPDRVEVVFKAPLSLTDKDILDGSENPAGGLIGSHDPTPYDDVDEVSIKNQATIQDPEKEVQRVAVQPGRSGYYMNGRDFLLKTAKMTDAYEDMRVDPATMKQYDWGEVTLKGCYKGNDDDGYTLCDDQTDADANACLSVFEYAANDQEDPAAPVDIDIMGGKFYVDEDLAKDSDKWRHRIYSIMAPDVPTGMGGGVPFFDNYMYPHRGAWTSCMNSLALPLDPDPYPPAAVVRIYLYYKEGTSLEHILALRMYRKKW